MAMLESTRTELERLASLYKGQTHSHEAWERIIKEESKISFSTFRKYVHFKVIERIIEHSIEEIVEQLNECAGEDCYYCSWHYEVVDGKIIERLEDYLWE